VKNYIIGRAQDLKHPVRYVKADGRQCLKNLCLLLIDSITDDRRGRFSRWKDRLLGHNGFCIFTEIVRFIHKIAYVIVNQVTDLQSLMLYALIWESV
jgi:hypothetical protein